VASVVLSTGLGQQFAGGETEFELEAASVRELLRELDKRFPGLGQHIEQSMAIAIDGEIFQDPYLQPIGADSEIYVLPKIEGG
jgi:molybdopterin converting factor small subunit